MPDDLAGFDIKRYDRARPEVISFAPMARLDWLRIARANVVELQRRIVRSRYPGHAAAVTHGVLIRPCLRAGVALLHRLGPPLPLDRARLGIDGFEEARYIQRIASRSDHHMV